jgi:hypothetical protein
MGMHNNEDILVLPEHLFINTMQREGLEADVVGQQENRPEIKEWKTTWPITEKDGVLLHHGCVVVLKEQTLQCQLLQQYHDHITVGHPGICNILQAIGQDFWWPTMKTFVTQYVKGCAICQSIKPNTIRAKPPLLPITVTKGSYHFQTVSLDLIMDLPMSQGNNAILTIVDHDCSKAAIFLPCTKEITVEGLAQLYAQHIFLHYGILQRIISDRDVQLTAQFTHTLCKLVGVTQNMSMVYHPQTDGQSECTNQRVEQYLCIYSNDQQDDWASLLPLAQFIHNSWPNETTSHTLFDLLIGYMPSLQISSKETIIPAINQRREWLKHL